MTEKHKHTNEFWDTSLLGSISLAAFAVWLTAAIVVVIWWGLSALNSRWWLISLLALSVLLVGSRWLLRGSADHPETSNKSSSWRLWAATFLGSLVWLAFAAQHSLLRLVLILGLGLASFMVGCLVGFLFTSYGQEKDTIGKVRDWLVGGITGLTIAEAANIKTLLWNFSLTDTPQDFALVVSVAILYASVGFFFMFLERELFLNPWLAASRAERGRLEGIEPAGQAALKLLQALPASILSGVHDVGEVVDDDQEKELRKSLFSPDVTKFLSDAEEAAKSGATVDWDVTSKVAYLRYYMTYFGDEKERKSEADLASQWILRALNIIPLHVDLNAKYADVLDLLDKTAEAVSILKRIERTPDAPAYIREWLGYYLLRLEGKEHESIHYSMEYHKQFPEETDSFFNIARAHARKYCEELKSDDKTSLPHSPNRKEALDFLRKALHAQPEYRKTFQEKWTSDKSESNDWKCMLQDAEFRELVGLTPIS